MSKWTVNFKSTGKTVNEKVKIEVNADDIIGAINKANEELGKIDPEFKDNYQMDLVEQDFI